MKRHRLAVAVITLALLLSAAAAWLLGTEAGLRWAWHQASTATDERFEAASVQGRLAGTVEIRELWVTTEAATVRVDQLTVNWSPLRLLVGRLHFQQVTAGPATVRLRQDTAPPPDGEPLNFEGIPVPLPVRLAQLRVEQLSIERGTNELVQFAAIHGAATLDRRGLHLDQLRAEGPWGRVETSGEIGNGADAPVALDIRWRLELPTLHAPLRGQGTVAGQVGHPRLEQRLTAPVDAHLRASLEWQGKAEPQWQLLLNSDGLRLDQLRTEWRPLTLAGEVRAEGSAARFRSEGTLRVGDPEFGPWQTTFAVAHADGRWQLDHLRADQAEGPAELMVNGQGEWRNGTLGNITAAIEWQALGWPFTDPTLSSPEGRLLVTGALADYRLEGAAILHPPAVPPTRIGALAHGDPNRLHLDSVTAEWLDGSVSGSGEIAWAPDLDWQLRLSAEGLDPAHLEPELHGRLGFALSGRGGPTPEGYRARLELDQLRGQLRGQAVSGGAVAELSGGALILPKAQLRVGSARASANGRFGAEWHLDWQLRADELARLHPQLGGQIGLSGKLAGPPEALTVDASGNARNLRVGDTRLADARLAVDVDLTGQRRSQVSLTAQGVEPPMGQRLERVELTGDGLPGEHRLAFDARTDRHRARIQADGSFADGQWRGRLHNGRISGLPPATWSQQAPTTLSVAAGAVSLDRVCWAADGSSACLSFNQAAEQPPRGDLKLTAFPLDAIEPFLIGSDIRVSGRVDADARLGPARHQLRLSAVAEEAGLRYLGADRPIAIPLEHLELAANATAEGLRASLRATSGEDAHLMAHIATPTWPPGADTAISGAIEATVERLDWITVLVPDLINPEGRVRVDLKVGGRLGEPVLRGTARLVRGSVLVLPAGIQLQAVSLTARTEDADRFELTGSARSGAGRIRLSGYLAGSPRDWTMEAQISGKEFEVMRIPKAQVFVTPDLHIVAAPYDLRLEGQIRIDRADIRLPEFGGDGVRRSPDVVIVGTEQPSNGGWNIHSQVTLILGDAVTLSGYGFNGRLEGELAISEEPGRIALGQGALMVREGRYEAYGQELTVEEGRLIYTGTPITDPALNIRAVREVDDVTVGILVRGRLQAPELELFSQPPMEESDALAYLLIGRPLSGATEQEGDLLYRAALSLGLKGGNTIARRLADEFGIEEVAIEGGGDAQESALVLGTHLSPRLYLQYAVGFAETVNRIRIRYELGKNWTLEAESGEYSSTDLLFTIER